MVLSMPSSQSSPFIGQHNDPDLVPRHDLWTVLLRWWLGRWLGFTLGLVGMGGFAYLLLHQISLVGAPGWEQLVGYVVLTQLLYVLMFSVDFVRSSREGVDLLKAAQLRKDLWQFGFRLMVGLALFPVVCVLFLNRSKF